MAASKSEAWSALLRLWQDNTEGLGTITRTDYPSGLLQASLNLRTTRLAGDDVQRWWSCSSPGLHLGIVPDSLTWSVVVDEKGPDSVVVRASISFWKVGWACTSTGEREEQLEAAVKAAAEASSGSDRMSEDDPHGTSTS